MYRSTWHISPVGMLFLVCSLVLDAPAQQELVINGGFETGSMAPWYGDHWQVSTENPHSGTYSAKCTMTFYYDGLRQDILSTPTSEIASVTFWIINPWMWSYVKLYYDDNSSEFIATGMHFMWSLVDLTDSLAPGRNLCGLQIWASSEESWAYLDDVSALTFSTPQIQITLNPVNPPIVIPGTGGTFDFTVNLTNNGSAAASLQVWTLAQAPSGSWVGPIMGPTNLILLSGSAITQLRTQFVPASAPAGTYSYEGRVGIYPNRIWDTDSFTVIKQSSGEYGDGELTMGDWESGGLDLLELNSNQNSILVSCHCLPNPFNPITAISYQLSANSLVSLRVYDTAGRLVAKLVDGWQEAGEHNTSFDGSSLPSGVYLYRLEAGGQTSSGKMVLLK